MPIELQPQFYYEAPDDGGSGGGEAPETPGGEEAEGVSSDGFYDLSQVAPELRPEVEKHLKAIEGRITPRLQEAAQLRKQWEPYQEAGVADIDPEELQGLLTFAELTSAAAQGDEEALARFGEWYERIGGELGLAGGSEDEDEYGEGEGSEEEVADKIAQAVEPLYQKMAEQEQEAMVQEQLAEVQQQTADLQSEHKLSDDDMDAILRFAASYDESEEDPIAKGFEDYQRLIGKGEKGLFADKSRAGKSPEGEGAADTNPKAITSFDEAQKVARERMAQSMAT